MKMWVMRKRIDEYDAPEALAVTMTRNNCIDHIRKWRRTKGEVEARDISDPDPSPTPLEQVVRAENADIMTRIIYELPQHIRDIVQLREINGLSYEEISVRKEMNINNLRVILSRARKMIKEKYLLYTSEKGRA